MRGPPALEVMEVPSLMERFPDMGGRVQMLWHSNYYDGPLSGYVELDGQPGYWVDCISDRWDERPDSADDSCTGKDGNGGCKEYPGNNQCCSTIWDRVFLVYKLDGEQDRIATENHALFREHVGTHTDYVDEPKRDYNPPGATGITLALGLKPRSEHSKFYKVKRPTMPPLREEQAVGHTLRLFIKNKSRR